MKRAVKRHLASVLALLGSVAVLQGCASPGAPKPPSLHLPAPVRDLTAVRSGDAVEISFMRPTQTSDGLPLRGRPLRLTLCRQDAPGSPCRTVPLSQSSSVLPGLSADASAVPVHLGETLPEPLRSGAPRPMLYRLEVRNAQGKSAGYSAPVSVLAGAAPAPVEDLVAQGTRKGVLLQWAPEAGSTGEVLLRREQITPLPEAARPTKQAGSAKSHRGKLGAERAPQAARDNGVVWLQADPGNPAANRTVDGTVVEGVRYRYSAIRRVALQKGEDSGLELRSTPSNPQEIAWSDVYAPPAPSGLTAVGFGAPQGSASKGTTLTQPSGYAVDLIWQPVDDLRVTGYLVWRTAIQRDGRSEGTRQLLTPVPVRTPSFHDASVSPSRTYRYEVAAVDARGNQSPAAKAVVEASLP